MAAGICQGLSGYGGWVCAVHRTQQTEVNSTLDALGQEDMVYCCFSYRSLFGQTYATLFPWRPKRVIIDGVVDSFNWYNGVFQSKSQLDTDAVLNGLFDECTKAGPENCTLAYIWVFADSM
ncbi:hypothetical protein BDW71DRAFT_151008 [Aspergillus fruticulosus]